MSTPGNCKRCGKPVPSNERAAYGDYHEDCVMNGKPAEPFNGIGMVRKLFKLHATGGGHKIVRDNSHLRG